MYTTHNLTLCSSTSLSRHRAAFVMGIGFVTVISWFRGTAITYFPDTDDGEVRFAYFAKVVSIEPLNKLLVPFTSQLGDVAGALVTFLYVDFLDTSVSTRAVEPQRYVSTFFNSAFRVLFWR